MTTTHLALHVICPTITNSCDTLHTGSLVLQITGSGGVVTSDLDNLVGGVVCCVVPGVVPGECSGSRSDQ